MINFRNVSFSYQNRKILNDLSLFIPQGSFHFLTGSSGSGKSTFLKLCSLDLFPDTGSMEVLNLDTQELNRERITELRRLIGVVHQESLFIDHLSVFENVLLPAIATGLDPDSEKDNVAQLLDWVGLGDLLGAMPQELSGGEKQRVALARSIIMAPSLILADEPTGNVDWEMGQRLLNLLIQLNGLGKTVIVATHDLNIIRAAKSKINAKILRINQGNIDIAGAAL